MSKTPFATNPPRTNRHGMSLLEVLVALVLLGIVGHGVWAAAELVGRIELRAWSREDALRGEAGLRAALDDAVQASGPIVSGPNVGALHVRVDSLQGDTIFILESEGAPALNATRTCPGTETCLLFAGDHRSKLAAGHLLLVGAASHALHLMEAIGPPQLVRLPCAADCPQRMVCEATPASDSVALQVVLGADTGTGLVAGLTCDASLAAGSACREQIGFIRIAPRRIGCNPAAPVGLFTSQRVRNRTNEAGFPPGESVLTRSAGPYPRVESRPVKAVRFWSRPAPAGPGGLPALVRERFEAGAWVNDGLIARGVGPLTLWTRHAGDTLWVRGSGAATSDFRFESTNRLVREVPSSDGSPAFEFLRGAHTVEAIRIDYSINVGSSVASEPRSLIIAMP